MPYPRCAAKLRDGSPCNRTTATPTAEFCVRHAKMLGSVDAETMRRGDHVQRRRRPRDAKLARIAPAQADPEQDEPNGTEPAETVNVNGPIPDPSMVRPR